MLTDIILLYILCKINAPIWCYVLVCIRFAFNLIKAGMEIGKSEERRRKSR